MSEKRILNKNVRIAIFAALMLFALILPLVIPNQYVIRLATLTVMYASLAVSLNLISGFMGQVSLGHAAFLGIGAYTSAILSMRLKWPFIVTVLIALLLSAVFGVILGIPSLKLSGSYLAIVSLGFCEIIRLIELNWSSLTRGPMGLTGIPRPSIFGMTIKSPAAYYYLAVVMTAIVCAVISNLLKSHYGRAIQSIREDPVAAEAMGVNVFRYKVMTFAISAAFCGFMGAFYAHYMRFVDPTTFNFEQSTQILSMVILGGSGSIPGSFIGALLLSVIPELLREFTDIRMLVYGLVIVVMIIFRPQGICGRKSLADLLLTKKKYAEKADRTEGGAANE